MNKILNIFYSRRIMKKFLNQRKKDNRKSLMIDNIDVDKLHNLIKRRNSISDMNINNINIEDDMDKNLDVNSKNNRVISNDSYSENAKQFIQHYENSIQESTYTTYEHLSQPKFVDFEKSEKDNGHVCNLCCNQSTIKDTFMILSCQHIFHIKCLVDNHYIDANRFGVIDEEYLNSRKCTVCNKQMEMEDILYIHNKFYKNTKGYITKQDEIISQLDKQMTKLKDELRTCFEYKQKLEHQREKSRQITVTINTLM